MRFALRLMSFAVVLSTGCTHSQLRRSTVSQVGTVADIYQQQVLNNLAKFAHDPNALPDFGVPTSGLATVSDTATAGNGWSWTNTALASVGLEVGGSRNINQNWSLKPVQDPRKLELMRCAYRNAVGKGGCDFCCPDCQKRFNAFYTGDPCRSVPEPCQDCASKEQKEACRYATNIEGDPENPKEKCEAELAAIRADTGIVTSACLGSCWFHVGCADCLKQIKKDNPCCLIGEHCGTVVWVTPGRGTSELSKLTIAILDYAVNDPKEVTRGTKQVVAYFRDNGKPTTAANAHIVVTATAPAVGRDENLGSDQPGVSAKSLRDALLGTSIKASDLLPSTSQAAQGAAGARKEKEVNFSDLQLEVERATQAR